MTEQLLFMCIGIMIFTQFCVSIKSKVNFVTGHQYHSIWLFTYKIASVNIREKKAIIN